VDELYGFEDGMYAAFTTAFPKAPIDFSRFQAGSFTAQESMGWTLLPLFPLGSS
jgi:hypothetical protein